MVNTLKNKKGITLIELIAIIVILGIIAAIAVPTIGGLINTQRENTANISFDNVMLAATTYYYGEIIATSSSDTEFTITEVVTAGYLSTNPFDGGIVVDFVIVGGAVQIDETDLEADLTINGFTVYTITP